jgi:hypothetical protein
VTVTADDILAHLLAADLLRFAVSIPKDGTTEHGAKILGRFRLDVLGYLHNHPDFVGARPALLHCTPRTSASRASSSALEMACW